MSHRLSHESAWWSQRGSTIQIQEDSKKTTALQASKEVKYLTSNHHILMIMSLITGYRKLVPHCLRKLVSVQARTSLANSIRVDLKRIGRSWEARASTVTLIPNLHSKKELRAMVLDMVAAVRCPNPHWPPGRIASCWTPASVVLLFSTATNTR